MSIDGYTAAFAGVPRRRGKPLDLRSLNRTFAWRRDVAARHRAICERLGDKRVAVEQCPICASHDAMPFATVHGFPYAQCSACWHVYMTAQPDEATVRHLYSVDKDARAAQANVYANDALHERRVAQIARPKVAFVADAVSPAGTWIDVGCATGEILTAARELGWSVHGIEADPTEVAFARGKGLPVTEEFVTEANAGRLLGDAAVVSLLNVLEHVNAPSQFLRAVVAPLQTGAHVVIEVPRHPSISSLANMLFPQIACRHVYAPEHLHVFSERAMERVLDEASLEAVSVWIFGQDFQELISSASVAANVSENAFLSSVFDLTPRLQQAIDDSDFADALFLVARKR